MLGTSSSYLSSLTTARPDLSLRPSVAKSVLMDGEGASEMRRDSSECGNAWRWTRRERVGEKRRQRAMNEASGRRRWGETRSVR
jgi:hypothetical protein